MEQVVYICIPDDVDSSRRHSAALVAPVSQSFVFSALLWDVERMSEWTGMSVVSLSRQKRSIKRCFVTIFTDVKKATSISRKPSKFFNARYFQINV